MMASLYIRTAVRKSDLERLSLSGPFHDKAAMEMGKCERTTRCETVVDHVGAGLDLALRGGAGHAVADIELGRLAGLPGLSRGGLLRRRRLLALRLGRPGLRGQRLGLTRRGRLACRPLLLRRKWSRGHGQKRPKGSAAGDPAHRGRTLKTPHDHSSCRCAMAPKAILHLIGECTQ